MKESAPKPSENDVAPSPLTVIRDLQNGGLSPTSISAEVRGSCVEHLIGEGYSVAEVAQVLSVSPRTVHRDLTAIRASHALQVDPQLATVMAGRLMTTADQSVQRLRRIARERETDPSVRVEAERASWTIMKELVESLQRLGHLPTAAQQIHADLVHHSAEPPTYAELDVELARVVKIMNETGAADDATRRQLTELQDVVTRSATAQQIVTLQKRLPAPSGEEGPGG